MKFNQEAEVVDGFDLKVARLKAGLHQYQVARKVGIAQPRLSEIEMGLREASSELIQRILEAIREATDEQVPRRTSGSER
jgi:transcriptional regulator with XRE-family HTH domain